MRKEPAQFFATTRLGRKGAFTLIELLAVIAILAIVALFAVPRAQDILLRARIRRAEADAVALRDAILSPDGGYLADMTGIPGFSPSEMRLGDLLIATNLYVLAARRTSGEYPTAVRAFPVEGERLAPDKDAAIARSSAFAAWSNESKRGWRGPYLSPAAIGDFPAADFRRFSGDSTAAERGFFPPVSSLYLPRDWRDALWGCSVYGFPGERAPLDPWGNPYVLQVPPPQAFSRRPALVPPLIRWNYARIVSAGPDGVLETPCFYRNLTNEAAVTSWGRLEPRLSRQAGRTDSTNIAARGDDIVLFLNRSDIDEGEEAWND